MPHRQAVRCALLCALAVLLASCGGGGGAEGGPERVTVSVSGLTVDAEVARTDEARALGLGFRDALAHDEGMLFVYSSENTPGFWMRGMRFPLDFIWIDAERNVVDLTLDVPAPAEGTLDSELTFMHPVEPVQYVLEVNAGLVREGSVSIGDPVTFEPEP